MDMLTLLLWLPAASTALVHEADQIEDFIKRKRHFVNKKYRPNYHITAPDGWLSNPTGFSYFKKHYHVFYQYHHNSGPGIQMRWGHAVSKNLVDWAHYPPALVPKEHYDSHGCYAGSSLVHDNHLYLFYTGIEILGTRTYETQSIAFTGDGIVFKKYLYNPIVKGSQRLPFRNPKVWRFRQAWYMIIGATSKDKNGQLLLYTSQDMFVWTYNGTLAESLGDMSHVWESPDIFEMMDQHVLVISADGVQSDGHRFKNAYQTGYVVGKFNYMRGQFEDLEISTATFNELDFGHDFYAAKTTVAPDGRMLLVAWLGMWESEFPELSTGWAGMLTLVREVNMNRKGQILMTPVREVVTLRHT